MGRGRNVLDAVEMRMMGRVPGRRRRRGLSEDAQ